MSSHSSHALKAACRAFVLGFLCVAVPAYADHGGTSHMNVNLSAPATSSGSHTVTWDNTTAITYELQEKFNSGAYTIVYSGTATSKSFSSLPSGTYTYRIHYQLNFFGNVIDLYSEPVSTVVTTAPPPPPSSGNNPSAFVQPAHDQSVGGIGAQHAVGTDGSANYSIPIHVLAGTAGVQPGITLSYNSNSGNGLVGMGWGIGGLSIVHRCSTTLDQDGFLDGTDFDSNDKYCLDGERLVAKSGTYGAHGTEYRTVGETFTKIVSYNTAGSGPQYFKAWTRDGRISEFGVTSNSRIEAQGRTDVLIWAINKIQDRYGNYMTVSYVEDNANGDYRPDRIDYTGNASAGLSPYNSIRFEYESRTDTPDGYIGGSRTKTLQRLKKIKTYSGSFLHTEYQLAYSYGSTTKRSLLQSITECRGGTCTNPTTILWDQGATGFSSSATNTGINNDGYQYNPQPTDVNGDGKVDLVVATGGYWKILLSNGNSLNTPINTYKTNSGWNTARTLDYNDDGRGDIVVGRSGYIRVLQSTGTNFSEINTYISSNGMTEHPKVMDVNGDGRQDLVLAYNNVWNIRLRQNVGFGSAVTTTASNVGRAESLVFDVDGDGMDDMLAPQGGYWKILRSTGSGFVTQNTGISWSGYNYQPKVMDVNGDGLQDVLLAYSNTWHILINKGGSFTQVHTGISNSGWDKSFVYDYDSDGLDDLVYAKDGSSYWHVLRSTGTTFTSVSTYISNLGWNYSPNVFDLTGDSQADLVLAYNNVWNIRKHNGVSPDRVTRLTNGLGTEVRYTYKPLTDSSVYIKGTDASYPTVDQQFPLYVVNSLKTSNGIGGFFTNSYSYKGLKYHLTGLGNLGFQEMTTEDNDTGIKTKTIFNQVYSSYTHGQTDRVTTTTGSVTLSDTENSWTAVTEGSGANTRYRLRLVDTEVTKRDLNGAFLHREMNAYSYDSYENVTGITSTVYDSANQILRTKVTSNTYKPANTGAWLIGLLEKATVTATVTGQPAITRKSSWVYDTSTGRKLKERILHPVSEAVLNETRYENIDSFGNHRRTVLDGPDFTSRQTNVVYESKGRFITNATNAKGHTTVNTYYADGQINAGLLNTSTDPNGLVSRNVYDNFGRTTETTEAHGSSNPVKSYTSFQWCSGMSGLCPANAVYGITQSSDGGAGSRVFVDKLGRETKRSTQRLDGRFAHIKNSYNSLGHNNEVFDPYFDGETAYSTSIEYDILGRATRSTFADGRVDTVTYNGLTRTSNNDINGLNQSKTEVRNSLDHLIQVTDSHSQTVTYTYDSLGNLKTATDPQSNVTTITYDELSRKVSMNDPDKGAWSYTYNGLNELVTQTNAKNQVTCTAYDVLGRMTKRIDNYQGSVSTSLGSTSDSTNQCANDASNPETSTWTYDTASGNALGKIHQVQGQGGYQESYVYDGFGRQTEVVHTIGGSQYKFNTSYDSLHRPYVLTYPGPSNRLAVRNVYSNIGYQIELRNHATSALYFQRDFEDARGNSVGETYGNWTNTYRHFAPETGRLESIETFDQFDPGHAPSIQQLSFSFDVIGNLTHRSDSLQSFTENFTYDDLNRLLSTSADFGNGDIRNMSVTYDALGNIKTKTGVGTYSYGGSCGGQTAGPHAVTNITAPKSATYCYDANGNMISGDGRTISYTPFDKPTVITKSGGNSSTISYGPNRSRYKRVDQTSAGTTTYTYAGGIYEKVQLPNGQVEERHTVGDFTIVTIKNRTSSSAGTTQTRYLHKDHLGSITVITDESAQIVEEFSFDPWGKRRAPNLAKLIAELGSWNTLTTYEKNNQTIAPLILTSTITTRGFTGHEQLDPVELIHMNGRVYDAEIGRFISADPVIQDRTNLQALNRYSYVQNNPLSYTDPSGYFLKKLFKKLGKVISAPLKALHKFTKRIRRSIMRAIGQVPGLSEVISAAYFISCGPWCSAVFNASMADAHGASPGEILKGAAIGYVTSFTGDFLSKYTNDFLGQSLAGGISSKANGGSFYNGFASGAFGFVANAAIENAGMITQTGSIKVGDEEFSYTTVGPEGYSEDISAKLTKISESEAGAEVLEGLVESEGEVTFQYRRGTAGASKATWSKKPITILYDPKYKEIVLTSGGIPRYADPTMTLAHELYHAWNNAAAAANRSFFRKSGARRIGRAVPGLGGEETWTVRHTNLIRRQLGYRYIRTHYLQGGVQYCVEGC